MLLKTHVAALVSVLQQNTLLVVERFSFTALQCASDRCNSPGCEYDKPDSAAELLFVVIHRVDLSSEERPTEYCLRCFEMLWNAKFMGTPPDVRVSAPRTMSIRTRDAFPPTLRRRDSAWELPHSQDVESADDERSRRRLSGSIGRSRSSSELTEGIAYPPTRMQHLAPIVTSGESLGPTEKAVIELWKKASDGQIRQTTICNAVQRCVVGYEVQAGLQVIDCLGRDLSEVFKIVR